MSELKAIANEFVMNDRIEKFKFRRQLRKIDWDSVIKVTIQTFKAKEHK